MPVARDTCYRCHKPRRLCVCARTPRVANRTHVTILQHRRERFHAVGTARLARLGLKSVDVIEAVGALDEPALPPGTALLYPAPDAVDLATVLPGEGPAGLLVLDGTWHHARRLYLDNPWLQRLPAVRLDPSAPSRYRIRRQARAEHVSTIESIVEALRLLEPDTPGMDGLIDAFDAMVDDQRRYMLDPAEQPRRQVRKPREARAVPARFFDHPERLLVVYGETAPLDPARRGLGRQLLTWTAVRPSTGETFERVLVPRGCPPAPEHLAHLDLTSEQLAAAQPMEQVARDWRAFRRDDDLVTAWNAGRLHMLRSLEAAGASALAGGHDGADAGHGAGDGADAWSVRGARTRADGRAGERAEPEAPLLLKALWCNVTHARSGTLDELVASLGLEVQRPRVNGRAALRLGQAVAVARHLAEVAPRMAHLPTAPQPS